VAKAAESLHSNKLTQEDVLLANGIEDSDASAKNGCILHRIDVCGYTNDGFSAEKYIFRIPTLTRNTIHFFIVAHLELSTLA